MQGGTACLTVCKSWIGTMGSYAACKNRSAKACISWVNVVFGTCSADRASSSTPGSCPSGDRQAFASWRSEVDSDGARGRHSLSMGLGAVGSYPGRQASHWRWLARKASESTGEKRRRKKTGDWGIISTTDEKTGHGSAVMVQTFSALQITGIYGGRHGQKYTYSRWHQYQTT